MTDYSECVFLYDWNVWRKIIIYIKWTQTRPSVCWLICSHDILVYALKDHLEKYSITDSFAKDFSLIFVMPYHSAVICKCLITTHMKTCSSLWKSLTTSSMPKSRGSIQLVVLSSKSSIHDLDLHGIFRRERELAHLDNQTIQTMSFAVKMLEISGKQGQASVHSASKLLGSLVDVSRC